MPSTPEALKINKIRKLNAMSEFPMGTKFYRINDSNTELQEIYLSNIIDNKYVFTWRPARVYTSPKSELEMNRIFLSKKVALYHLEEMLYNTLNKVRKELKREVEDFLERDIDMDNELKYIKDI